MLESRAGEVKGWWRLRGGGGQGVGVVGSKGGEVRGWWGQGVVG